MAKRYCCFVPKNKNPRYIKNHRPITLLHINYRIWESLYVNRLQPYTNLTTIETQAAYKTGRPDVDILPIIQNRMQIAASKQLMLIDLGNASDSTGRNTSCGILYAKGFRGPIQQIRLGHMCTKI